MGGKGLVFTWKFVNFLSRLHSEHLLSNFLEGIVVGPHDVPVVCAIEILLAVSVSTRRVLQTTEVLQFCFYLRKPLKTCCKKAPFGFLEYTTYFGVFMVF